MRLVLDCNVVIAAGLTSGVCARVVIEVVRHHELVVSDPVLAEHQTVATRRKLRWAAPRLREILSIIEAIALWVEPTSTKFGIGDPDDEVYLQTAEGGGAAALITGNHRHFPEPHYGGIAVLSPRAFVNRHG